MSISKKTVQLFIEGDKTATGEVFEEYKNLLYFIIATYINNKDQCDDVLSETFLKSMEHRKELKDPKKIKSFLSTIAKNEALQFLRKNKVIVSDNIDEMYGKEDQNDILLDLCNSLLNEKETIVTYYRAVFSYSWKEILEETNIPISSAKLLYSNAKKKLRKALI